MNMLTKRNKFIAYAMTTMMLSGFGFSTVQAAPVNHHEDRRQNSIKIRARRNRTNIAPNDSGMNTCGTNGRKKTGNGWNGIAMKNPEATGAPMSGATGNGVNERNGSGKRAAGTSGRCIAAPGKAIMNGMSGNAWKMNGMNIGCGRFRRRSPRQ